MELESAIRATEILMGLAFIQQSLEHCKLVSQRPLFIPRILLSLLLIIGLYTSWVLYLLLLLALVILHKFQGPYNGGADRMGLLILSCLCLIKAIPILRWQEIVFAYLAFQLILSYFISGWVKLVNSDWRKGRALSEVFEYSAYPVSEQLRKLVQYPRLLFYASWAVILFELLFPLAVFSLTTLIVALTIAFIFHFTNACLFGLNRFVWIWVASYPSLLWFQARVITY